MPDRPAIEVEKYQRCSQSHPLVAIDKGMVGDQMEEVGCSHLEEIGMKEVTAKYHLRLRYRGFKETTI